MKLVKCFGWLVAVVALGSGCIISSSDDDTVDSGVFHATWTVNDSTRPAACAGIGAEKVSFLFTRKTPPHDGFDQLFDCADFSYDTDALPIDGYTYVPSLLDCPTGEKGCPGGVKLDELSPLDDDFFSCHDVSGGICFVDLPEVPFQR